MNFSFLTQPIKNLCLLLLFMYTTYFYAEEASYGISGNPGAVNVLIGTGALGDLLRVSQIPGVRLGGLWSC